MPTEWEYVSDAGQEFLNSIGILDEAIIKTGRSNGILHLKGDPDKYGGEASETKCGQALLMNESRGRLGQTIREFGQEVWSLSQHSPTHKLCGKCVSIAQTKTSAGRVHPKQ